MPDVRNGRSGGFYGDPNKTLRVATKFPHIAGEYYESRSRDIDVIRLNGSIELAPSWGLSDVIVDIVGDRANPAGKPSGSVGDHCGHQRPVHLQQGEL